MSWFPASLERIFGCDICSHRVLIGVPWKDCVAVGNLLGTRMAINELVAYSMLGRAESHA